MDASPDPKLLVSGRPGRYEIEDHDVSSPPTYTLLKAFDASHIFRKNPHKYDQLIAQEDGYSKDDSAFSYSEIDVPSAKFDDDFQPRVRTRSNSLTSLDVMALALENSPARSQPIVPAFDDSKSVSATNRADNMYRRCSLDHMADYYSRRSSDAAVTAIWEPTGHAGWRLSNKTTVESAVTSYKPDKKKAEAFGERSLTDIMMKAAFVDPVKSSKKNEETTQPKDRRASTEGTEAPSTTSTTSKLLAPQDRRMSLPETATDVKRSSLGDEVSVRMTTVQPKPRRLFGIGPLYHPLPETVVEDVSTVDGSLVGKIKKEGLGTGTERKTAPTKAEVNTWAPFSM